MFYTAGIFLNSKVSQASSITFDQPRTERYELLKPSHLNPCYENL